MVRLTLTAVTLALLVTVALAPQARAEDMTDEYLAMWDTDHDGTLDLAEANKVAAAKFAKLDVDHDGSLTKKELGNLGVTTAEFDAADTDHEGTLDVAEYQSIVAERFHAADKDNDGTLTLKELITPVGRHLQRLL
ncbi:MAG: calcium-binding protein [Alphaproteobacteria bacterium]